MRRLVDVDSEPVAQCDNHQVEALQKANRVGFGLFGGKHREGDADSGDRVRDQ